MFSLRDLEAAPFGIVQLFQQLQDWTIHDIARRIRKAGLITSTAEYQITALTDYRLFDVNFKEELQRTLKLTDRQIEALYKEASNALYLHDRRVFQRAGIPFTPFEDNFFMQNLVRGMVGQAQGDILNLTKSLGFATKVNGQIVFKPVAKFYQDELNLAVTKVATGVSTFDQALKQAVQKMADSGLRIVDYATGHTNRIDVAARRAVMGAMRDLTNAQSDYNATEMGTTVFEISWHGGHRPTHGWGGRRFDVTGQHYLTEEKLYQKYPGPDGKTGSLNDYNCYHFKYSVFPDSPPAYTDEQLDQLEAKEKETKIYEGKEYTPYEARQQQRKIERAMRFSRSKIAGLEGGELSDEEVLAAKTKYTQQRRIYKEFSTEMGLRTEFERVYTGTIR